VGFNYCSGTRPTELLRLRYISAALCQNIHERPEALVRHHSRMCCRLHHVGPCPTYPFLHSVRRRRKAVGFLPTNTGTAPRSAAIATSWPRAYIRCPTNGRDSVANMIRERRTRPRLAVVGALHHKSSSSNHNHNHSSSSSSSSHVGATRRRRHPRRPTTIAILTSRYSAVHRSPSPPKRRGRTAV
jgi:hypothetical protein